MKFGDIPVEDSAGSLLAHSVRTSAGKIRKGQRLTAALVQQLQADGIANITVAQLDSDDIHEDEAALQLATALAGEGLRLGKASTGRVNLHAQTDGICDFERTLVYQANLVNEGITIATVHPSTSVGKSRLVATVKIIPYAVSKNALQQVLAGLQGRQIRVHATVPQRAALIQTRLPGMRESILDKTVGVTRQRLLKQGAQLTSERRVSHDVDELVRAMSDAVEGGVDWLLVAGASAISDRQDIVPSAIVRLGGQVEHFGMPMDPGNLLLIGRLGNTSIIGLPGCARSPKPNGLDKVLERLSARLPVSSGWIASLGVGGLLHEIVDRPEPRVRGTGNLGVAALVLAAGSSRRFGEHNKLLATQTGKPLLTHVLDAVGHSGLDSALVVTGHDAESVEQLCQIADQRASLPISTVHNALHASGMASSLICGIGELGEAGVDAVIVCLADMPEVTASVMQSLLAAYRLNPGKALYIPTYQGQRGNPVLIAASLFDSVLRLEGDVGARVLARDFPDCVQEVPCDSAGILKDIDEPSDLQPTMAAS
ncbi:NTP transferase domain-containing protein [Granulosicoccus sp. 3-233]|uniref:NTP transferase domain-containing protein n=1 Tax=Granulosicoccus sp. 3-233 TaxID=3417969 RepID=UPI003D3479F9